MAKIKAKGKRKGVEMIVRVVDGVVYINGLRNDMYDWALHKQHPIGGTYYAEPDSMTNIANTLRYHFFDETPEFKTEGEFEEITYEEGKIY